MRKLRQMKQMRTLTNVSVNGVVEVNGSMEYMTNTLITHINSSQTSIGVVDVGRCGRTRKKQVDVDRSRKNSVEVGRGGTLGR